MRKGLTCWCWRVGRVGIMFRWNLRHLGMRIHKGRDGHGCGEIGPVLVEW